MGFKQHRKNFIQVNFFQISIMVMEDCGKISHKKTKKYLSNFLMVRRQKKSLNLQNKMRIQQIQGLIKMFKLFQKMQIINKKENLLKELKININMQDNSQIVNLMVVVQ
ncbi:unnamed protein product [Paramecium sonneborni]|uniref:Uncharacterized protein n=1 Tax=Paramecium sonneborni TaxID=65129 RepID=A0A8S1R9I7_9CILI|nr:unnamed protein product [Paramecium sonneborni]